MYKYIAQFIGISKTVYANNLGQAFQEASIFAGSRGLIEDNDNFINGLAHQREIEKDNSIQMRNYSRLKIYVGELLHHLGELTSSSDVKMYFNSEIQGQALSKIGLIYSSKSDSGEDERIDEICDLLNLDKNKINLLVLADDLTCIDWKDRIKKFQ